jgi:hypothetical protein
MSLVCPRCHYHAQHADIFECPRCAIDLEDARALRPERRLQKTRKNFNVRRDPKRIFGLDIYGDVGALASSRASQAHGPRSSSGGLRRRGSAGTKNVFGVLILLLSFALISVWTCSAEAKPVFQKIERGTCECWCKTSAGSYTYADFGVTRKSCFRNKSGSCTDGKGNKGTWHGCMFTADSTDSAGKAEQPEQSAPHTKTQPKLTPDGAKQPQMHHYTKPKITPGGAETQPQTR